MVALTISSCAAGKAWSVDEVQGWYQRHIEKYGKNISHLHYKGSDEKAHHFVCRTLDELVELSLIHI